MQKLSVFQFKNKRKRSAKKHLRPVCQVVVHYVSTGKVERKYFTSWDDARSYIDERSSDKYRMYTDNV